MGDVVDTAMPVALSGASDEAILATPEKFQASDVPGNIDAVVLQTDKAFSYLTVDCDLVEHTDPSISLFCELWGFEADGTRHSLGGWHIPGGAVDKNGKPLATTQLWSLFAPKPAMTISRVMAISKGALNTSAKVSAP